MKPSAALILDLLRRRADGVDLGLDLRGRFWSQVDATGDCWVWTGGLNRKGYGRFSEAHRRSVPAHRFAYESLVGPLPDGLQPDHLCRNRACVNPDHMEPVTRRTNILRGHSPAARAARRSACVNGHPYDERNTHIRPDGARACRACGRIRVGRRYVPRQRADLA